MFTMDVPTIPAQETPMVLAQAAAPSQDYVFRTCEETLSTRNAVIDARSFSPAASLADYLGKMSKRNILGDSTAFSSIKTVLLEDTKHGKMISRVGNVGSSTGQTYFVYEASPNYQGKDTAVFMSEFEGKHYKIILELHVFAVAPMENQSVNSCPPPKLMKVNKPSSGASGFGAGYDLSSVSVTFAGLSGAAVSHRTP